MSRLALILCLVAALLAGCGEKDEDAADAPPPTTAAPAETKPAPESKPAPEPTGTEIVLGDSEFGSMLFNDEKQAIYIFEKDSKDRTNCYGECAAAWPPVFTDGEPKAGKGVRQSLLGTVKRRDGKLQVTYAGQPLYYYVNEAPGEVRCHNVNLNGGLWWVVGPDGKRRP
jgi:predicted lipoprotein with Yx(FWY)xxD motif